MSFIRGDDRFLELIEALSRPETAWCELDQPDILTALDELASWAADGRTYEPVHRSGWVSAIGDFRSASSSVGSNVMSVLHPHIAMIQRICQGNVGNDQLVRNKLRPELAAMRSVLGERSTLKAAWADLRGSCSRKETPIGTVELRRDAFWALARAGDRNATELSRNLCDVLSGRRLDAFLARIKLGEEERGDADFDAMNEPPYSEVAERLDLVVRLLDLEPAPCQHVVWLAFKHATLNSFGPQSGAMQFYYADRLYGNLFEDGPFKDKIPDELRKVSKRLIPNQHDVVMVRVDLGVGAFTDAVRVAVEQVDALLGIAMIDSPLPWKRVPGFIHLQSSGAFAEKYFSYDDERTRSTDAMSYTAADLDRIAPRVTPLIPIRDPQFTEIIDALHWWRSGQSQPTAASIVLNVRVIELIASRLGETSWTTYLEKYVKNRWLDDAITRAIYRPLNEVLYGYVDAESREQQQALFAEVVSSNVYRPSFDLAKAAQHFEAIAALYPDNTALGRELRTLKKQTSNSDAIQSWVSKMESIWGRSVHRLERVRNSIAHGGPFTEPGVLLCQPLSRRLSVWALWESIEGFLHGKNLVQAHQDVRDKADRRRLSLQSANSITDLFGNG